MRYSPEMIRIWMIGKDVSPADAAKFSQLDWIGKIANGDIELPKGLPPLNGETIAAYKKQAKDAGVSLEEFAQQKLAPSTIQATPPGPAVAGGTAAAAQAAADIPQPISPTPQMAGNAPSPLGPLPVGTSTMAAPPEMLPSSSALPFGTTQPQPIAPPNDMPGTMAGFAPVTPQGGGGITPGNYAGFDVTAPWVMDRLQADFNLTRDQAAGIVGNLAHESGGFATYHEMNQPAGKGGVGWPQYTNSGGAMRRTDFEKWAAANNADPMGSEPNYQYLKEQLQGPYKRALDAVKDTSTRSEATRAFEKWFEGAKVKNWGERDRYANLAAKMEPQGDAFPTDVELQDAGVTPASWLDGGEYRPLGEGAPAPAPETLPTAPPPAAPSASDPFAGNVEPPPFTQGPTAAPPPPAPVLGAPVLGGAGGDFMPPQGSSDTLGTAYGDPVLGGMGGDLASGDGSLGPLIDPSMPLPTRAPTPPIVSMPMPLQSMMQTPLEPQLPTSPMQIPTRSTYSSNMSPIDQPPMSPFDPAAAPPLGAPSYDMANTFDPSLSQYDMANQFSPAPTPPATPQYDMANQFSPAMPQFDMANQFSPTQPPPPTPTQSFFDEGEYRPLTPPPMPQFDMANTFTPTPSSGPPGTVPSSTDPNTYVPPGFGVAGAAGFTPPPMSMAGWPSIAGTPSFAGAPSTPQGVSTPETTTPTAFDPTQAPGVGGVPAMPSWAIPGAFGMGPGSPLGGTSSMQFAGGTSNPASFASSTGQYGGVGFNPATAPNGAIMGAMGPSGMFAPGGTNWSDRMHGGVGGGPISESASLNPAGTGPASSASMESHALALMAAQDTADQMNFANQMAQKPKGFPVLMTIGGSDVAGLTGGIGMNRQAIQSWQSQQHMTPPAPIPMPIRPYGMNVGFGNIGSGF